MTTNETQISPSLKTGGDSQKAPAMAAFKVSPSPVFDEGFFVF